MNAPQNGKRQRNQLQDPLYGAGDVALGYFLLAMAYHQTGDCVRAMVSYRIAVQMMDTCRPSDYELMILRAEAADLLGMTEKPRSAGKKEDARPPEP
jgi:hypothetical protein